MNILVIGSGGREHALAWKAAQSEAVETVFVAPGNAGTAIEPGLKNLAIDVGNFEALANFANTNNVGLTIVGPEQPLVDGIVDFFSNQQLAIFGPSSGAAQLEGSKSFTKDFLARHNIPTAFYDTFTEVDAAIAYINKIGAPIVVKADGLAAGKGVIVAMDIAEAETAVRDMLAGNVFGEAGHRVVIEEFLDGEEASFIVMADGVNVLPMATSQDHKRVGEGDTGPNTGGMGAYSPAPVVNDAIYQRIMDEVIYPTVKGMAEEGNSYTGFLYAGLMIMADGTPKVIEYNCRFGDPETQPILLRLKSSLVELCLSAIDDRLNDYQIQWTDEHACGVVIASHGYPQNYTKNNEVIIKTYDAVGIKLFHAGTKLQGDKVLTSGGRVFCATALGKDLQEAQLKAYDLVESISFDGAFYRKDIGNKGIR